MANIIVAAVADLHVGHRVGLCSPEVALDGGGSYKANRAQERLWQAWQEFWRYVGRLRRNKELVVLLLGDLVEPPGRANTWATCPSEIYDEALRVLRVAKELSGGWNALYVCRGTPFHVGEGGNVEEELAKALGAVPDAVGQYARYGLLLRFGDYVIDAAHHAWVATRQWTVGGNAARYTAEVLATYAELREEPPDLILRAHGHRVADTGATFRNTRCVFLPAWQLVTEYGHKRGVVRPADIGGAIVKLPKGLVEVKIALTVRLKQAEEAYGQNGIGNNGTA